MAGFGSDTDAVLIKFNSNLQTDNDENLEAEWAKVIGGRDKNQTINSVKQIQNGYVFTGTEQGKVRIGKLDSDRSIQW